MKRGAGGRQGRVDRPGTVRRSWKRSLTSSVRSRVALLEAGASRRRSSAPQLPGRRRTFRQGNDDVANDDAAKWNYRLSQAHGLYDHGSEFGDNAALAEAIGAYRDALRTCRRAIGCRSTGR